MEGIFCKDRLTNEECLKEWKSKGDCWISLRAGREIGWNTVCGKHRVGKWKPELRTEERSDDRCTIMMTHAPVSYTHLDVYKRQHQ